MKEMNRLSASLFLAAATTLPACSSEVLDKQAEQIKQQESQIVRQRRQLDAILAGQKMQEQKQQDCNRAFRDYFEKAQASSDPDQAIVLYREGLSLCTDDDIAHFELGEVLAERGRYGEAEREFEAALKINPDFIEAKKHLEDIRKSR